MRIIITINYITKSKLNQNIAHSPADGILSQEVAWAVFLPPDDFCRVSGGATAE